MIKLLIDCDSILMHNKDFPVHAIKAYWESRSRAPSIPSELNFGESPGRFTSVKDTQNILYRSVGGLNKIFLR
jgi:hypothetical protein